MDSGGALQAQMAGFDYSILGFFALVLVAVSIQNWVLARRAENKPLLPSWLRPGSSNGNEQPPPQQRD